MKKTIIVAMDKNRLIGKSNPFGREGSLPWHIPEDFKHFKKTTTGHSVIMGRRTWNSLPKKPLPNRHNIVLTSDTCFDFPCGHLASSLDAAFEIAEELNQNQEVFIIGGLQVYIQALPFVDRLLVSHIKSEYEGDKYFPSLDGWEGTVLEQHDQFDVVEYLPKGMS